MGRTGTFTTVDVVMEQAEKERKVGIAGIVNRLREQRMKMAQTEVSLRYYFYLSFGAFFLLKTSSLY